MDWMNGELLIYRIKENPYIEKEVLFTWMRQLLYQVRQYHQCHNNRNYRYLNPYSVLVARDGSLILLDLEAESNEFVLRNLQKRAMRAHFVKPVMHIRESLGDALDIYAYGKTIQFILANINVEPPLKRSQENKLEKIIKKCLNETKGKPYDELKQIDKELPVIRDKNIWEEKKQFLFNAAAAVSIIVSVICGILVFHVMHQQKIMKNWILELKRIQSEENEELYIGDVEMLVEDLMDELEKEIKYTEEGIADVSEQLEQHIREAKSAEQKADEESEDSMKIPEETSENETGESETAISEEMAP